jgi:hypothetical protein
MRRFWCLTLGFWHPLEPAYEAVHDHVHERLIAYSPPVEELGDEEEDGEDVQRDPVREALD